MVTLDDAPDDTISLVFEYLTHDLTQFLSSIPLVCSRFHAIQRASNSVWRELLRVHAPLFNEKQLTQPLIPFDDCNLSRNLLYNYCFMLTGEDWHFSRDNVSLSIAIHSSSHYDREADKYKQRSMDGAKQLLEKFRQVESGRIVQMTESVGSGTARKAYSGKALAYDTGKYWFKFRIFYMAAGDNYLVGVVLKPKNQKSYTGCTGSYVEAESPEKYFEYYVGEAKHHFSFYVLEGSAWNSSSSITWMDDFKTKYVQDTDKPIELVVGVFLDTTELTLGYTVNEEEFKYDKLIQLKDILSAEMLDDYKNGLVNFHPAVCMGEPVDSLSLETNIIRQGKWISANLTL